MGHYERSLCIGQEALRISQAIENLWGQSYSQYRWGWVHWDRGRIDLALAAMENSLHLARLSGFGVPLVLTHADAAMLYAELGDVGHALEVAKLALIYGEKQRLMLLPYALGALAQAYIGQGNTDEAEAILARAKLDSVSATNNIYYAPALVARAMLSLQQEDYARAVGEARRLGGHSVTALRSTAYLMEAQAWQALGKIDAALACLDHARQEAKTTGSRRTLWRILHLLSELESDDAKAENARRQARRIVRTIANYIPRAELRATFLDTSSVRRLLDAPPTR
jgi:tetratricopeptide (TPR) repeat protein